MKFCWTTIMVKDMEASLAFYTEVLGLKVNRQYQAGPDAKIAFLGEGDTEVELICNTGKPEVHYGDDISMGFEVQSLEEVLSLLKQKGIDPITDILKPNPHVQFFYVRDPNGLKIQFVQNL